MAPSVERVPTGIEGLDAIIKGGFPKNSVVLTCGQAGSGKTILGLQYLYTGALKGERGLFIAFEQSPEELRTQAAEFNWDLTGMEEKKLIELGRIFFRKPWSQRAWRELEPGTRLQAETEKATKAIEIIHDHLTNFKPQRMVIDPVTSLSMIVPDEVGPEVRKEIILDLFDMIKSVGCTCLITTELMPGSAWYSRDTVTEFMTDGIIRLGKIEALGKRTLSVDKMRSTPHDFLARTLSITDKGIVIESR